MYTCVGALLTTSLHYTCCCCSEQILLLQFSNLVIFFQNFLDGDRHPCQCPFKRLSFWACQVCFPQVLFEIIIFLDLPTLTTFSTLQGEPLKVLVTGAAGQIAYSLLYSVAKGDVFGKDQVGFLSSF